MVQSADKPSHSKLTCKCETREFDLLCDAFICCERSSTIQPFHVFEREMAQRGNQADEVKFCCLICLDRLKDPVTKQLNNDCMNCIKTNWDQDRKKIHSCPQCLSTPRPVMVKLAELVEELKMSGLQADPAMLDLEM